MANPTLLKTPIASGGDKNTIPETTGSTTGLLSQEKGWQQINSLPINAGGIAPSRLDFNGVFNLLSNILFYAQKGWQWEFDETQDYFAGCTVKDTVDGKTYVCIADVNASTTHPSSDTTHWKLSDLATKGDLANYLPLAGGSMKGITINRNVDTSKLALSGGSTGGGIIEVYGKSFSDDASLKGGFAIYTNDGTNSKILKGLPTGALSWGGANILTDENGGYLPLSGGTMTGNTIHYADNSPYYLRIFGGPENQRCANIQLMGSSFNDTSKNSGRIVLQALSNIDTDVTSLFIKRDGTLFLDTPAHTNMDLGGSAIVAKSLGATGYSKRADGLIEQWGQTTAPATVSDKVPMTFPITFPNAVSSVVITSEGNLVEGNSAMSYTQVIDVTNSGFKYRSFSNSPGEIKKYWRAIGY